MNTFGVLEIAVSHGRDSPKVKISPLRKIAFPALMALLLMLATAASRAQGRPAARPLSMPGVETDRWLEIDLYWFNKDDMEGSANAFWDRYSPLMSNVVGWKGVILNVGWVMDSVLEWSGSLDQEIKLPTHMTESAVYQEHGQLPGDTDERMKLFEEKNDQAAKPRRVTYQKWTYRDLQRLQETLKKVAAERYGMNDVRVGIMMLAWKSAYRGSPSTFSKAHPEVFTGRINYLARLTSDPATYGAYPHGIAAGTPLTEFFGRQWGSMSKAVGLDAIVLRDSFLGVSAYSRGGPYGPAGADDPAKVAAWSQATANLVRETKESNPRALVIGYSTGACAVADWRVECCDLESIAKQGYMDGYIDQTWAGAWNEVGERPRTFWNSPTLGWTYQLAYMLVHSAVLAESRVHHYALTETFDAWESWDVIHDAPNRLRWGIWAYSHAAVITPTGLKMPAGNYISWCNRGKDLLSASDVKFLADNLNAANLDAHQTTKVFGPTLVYCRSAMEWQARNQPNVSIQEWMDEQFGTVSKWSVPILSITRSEYLGMVNSDLFLYQTPVHLGAAEKTAILANIRNGLPTVIAGGAAGGLDKDIADAAGITGTPITGVECTASINNQSGGI
jgi:hypothetical protein